MTCIVGMIENGTVYIGGDSALTGGWQVRAAKRPKVFRNGEFIMAGTGYPRMTQLLEYALEAPAQEACEGLSGAEIEIANEKYMITVFAEAVRECLKKHGFAKVENEQEEFGTFMVGYRGSLYCVESNLQVLQYRDEVSAIGSGEQYALGALHAMQSFPELDARERISRALEAAAHFDGSVAPPFEVLSTST